MQICNWRCGMCDTDSEFLEDVGGPMAVIGNAGETLQGVSTPTTSLGIQGNVVLAVKQHLN